MKILFLIDVLTAGGKERQLSELIKGLSRRKDVTIHLAILSHDIHYLYVRDLNVPVHHVERNIRKDPRIFAKLYKICMDCKPDIIHTWDSMSSVYAMFIAKVFNSTFVNGMIQNAPASLSFWDKRWLRSRVTFPFSDVVLSNSRAGLRAYAAPTHKSQYIHNGFDFSRIINMEDEDTIRRKFRINTQKIVGMVARFDIKKDYETFILSAIRILQKRRDVTFLTVGDGNTLDKSKKMVTQQLQDKIVFLGKQDNVESIINIFDVGVLATYTEGISNSIMEYMALAKPVIATNGGGTDEIVVNNKTGFLVEPNNVINMAEKIEFLLDNEEMAKTMGSAGKERLLRNFGIEEMIDRQMELYQKCIGTFSG
jgi:glycosyltransferase involved in cell wall biosynthesis